MPDGDGHLGLTALRSRGVEGGAEDARVRVWVCLPMKS